jgi:hypothetical protein
VRKVDGLSDLNVVGERNVLDLNVVERPLVEELDLTGVSGNVLWQDSEGLRDLLRLDFSHDVCLVV